MDCFTLQNDPIPLLCCTHLDIKNNFGGKSFESFFFFFFINVKLASLLN